MMGTLERLQTFKSHNKAPKGSEVYTKTELGMSLMKAGRQSGGDNMCEGKRATFLA